MALEGPDGKGPTAKKGVGLLAGVTDSDCRGEMGLPLQGAGTEGRVWSPGFCECPLALPCKRCRTVKLNGNWRDQRKGSVPEDTDSLGLTTSAPLPHRKRRAAKVPTAAGEEESQRQQRGFITNYRNETIGAP